MKRWGTLLAALVVAGAGVAAVPATATATTVTSQCQIYWGSLLKERTELSYKPLAGIRTGRHECYDRMVFDVPGTTSAAPVGYRVRYVDTLYQNASGEPIPVNGGAILQVEITAPTYDLETGEPTYPARAGEPLPGVDLGGYRTFRDAVFAGSWEGTTQVGLGVRARLPFRVFQLDDRLVVDVAHTW
jgi:hypothetical protein